jgi:uncharacterized protein
VFVLQRIGDALNLSFQMFWQIFWPLSLGFLLSSVVETQISKQAISRALGRDSARSVAVATAFGAASSSCSYAAVALARSLFGKGATLANAIIFEFASTNLVFELGLVLVAILGWQFLGAELAGGLLMVVLLAALFRLTFTPRLAGDAQHHAERGLHGRMEGHAAMDMSVTDGPLAKRLFSSRGLTAVSHMYFMNVYSLWFDLVLGLLIAGALGAWVPDSVWSALFLKGHGFLSELWGAAAGPLIAMLSFVCSVGNIPLAAVLWRRGISFGGVIAFVFGDLLILPILDIYRKYYGGRVTLYLFAVSYAAMALAGLAVGRIFTVIGAVPSSRNVAAFSTAVSLNLDTVLNAVFIVVTALLAIRFVRTGGVAMLRMMESAPEAGVSAHAHHSH